MANHNSARFYVTLGLDPRVHSSAWAPIEVDARVKPGHDESA
jgi:hypothetical protein